MAILASLFGLPLSQQETYIVQCNSLDFAGKYVCLNIMLNNSPFDNSASFCEGDGKKSIGICLTWLK